MHGSNAIYCVDGQSETIDQRPNWCQCSRVSLVSPVSPVCPRTEISPFARFGGFFLTNDFGLRHLRSKPCSPLANGKAERFIQTALREWAGYEFSPQRAQHLLLWLYHYNWHRPHVSL